MTGSPFANHAATDNNTPYRMSNTNDWKWVFFLLQSSIEVDSCGEWHHLHQHQGALAHTFRYEMRREPQEIIPKLWLGPFQASTNLAKMQALGLTHV
jgi:serine/threonine/tyrosine-interacting protein